MNYGEPALFALGSTGDFGAAVARVLGIALTPVEERSFEDGEHKFRPLESVRGRDAFILHSLYGDACQSPNDKLCQLLFFIGALKDGGASRITALVPYLCYARKDRRTKPRDPVTSRYVAMLFDAMGVDGVLTMDVHNSAAYENAFRCRTYHLEARHLFVNHFINTLGAGEVTVVSPDAGGMKRAERFREALEEAAEKEIAMAILEKKRSGGVVSGNLMAGDLRGRVAIIVDDLISTGTTLMRAARTCREAGAIAVHAAATHGLFTCGENVFKDPVIDGLVITDTVAFHRGRGTNGKVTVLPTAPLIAEAVRRLNLNRSLAELSEVPPFSPHGRSHR